MRPVGDGERRRSRLGRGNQVINVGNIGIGVNACDGCTIENNVIVHEQARGASGIAAPNRARDSSDLPMTNVTIRNNSILFGPSARGRGIVLGEEGTGHIVTSNAIQYLGTDINWSCFGLDLPSSAYSVVDHNLCFAPMSSGRWNGGEDLETWQASSAFDGSSTTADPSFMSTTAPHDLSASSSDSPLVDSGHPSESSGSAYGGADRDDTPDIGAHEL